MSADASIDRRVLHHRVTKAMASPALPAAARATSSMPGDPS